MNNKTPESNFRGFTFSLTPNLPNGIISLVAKPHADVAELADAPDLGSGGRPWGFMSLHPQANIEKTESNHDSVFSVNMLTNILHKIFLNNFF